MAKYVRVTRLPLVPPYLSHFICLCSFITSNLPVDVDKQVSSLVRLSFIWRFDIKRGWYFSPVLKGILFPKHFLVLPILHVPSSGASFSKVVLLDETGKVVSSLEEEPSSNIWVRDCYWRILFAVMLISCPSQLIGKNEWAERINAMVGKAFATANLPQSKVQCLVLTAYQLFSSYHLLANIWTFPGTLS